MLIKFDINDINQQFARNAYKGTSWTPERRGDQVREDYVQHMTAVSEEFEKWVTDDNREEMAADLEHYRVQYLKRLNAYLSSHSRVVSQAITGAGGWTGQMIRRNEKRGDILHRRMGEWVNFPAEALPRLRRKYNPVMVANRPINSGDPDALERLLDKLAGLERNQELMKACNKAIRQGMSHEDTVSRLQELGLSRQTAEKILIPDYMNRIGFPSFSLTNNGAEIRRIKGRIEEVQARAGKETREVNIANGVTVTENREENRLQVFFPGKPAPEIIKLMKYHGFKWAPSWGCWQRQLTGNAIHSFKNYVQPEIVKVYGQA